MSSRAAAHGFGQRFDLPLPLDLWVWSAGGTIILTFVMMALFVGEAPEPDAYPRLRLARFNLARGAFGGIFIAVLRFLAAAVFVLTIAAGLFGNQDPYHNLAPTMIWIVWWVGFAFTCALIGNLWGLVNPFATWFGWAERLYAAISGGKPLSRDLPYPAWLGAWPAVVIFAGFTWAELIWTDKDVPGALARVALGYAVLTWAGMFLWGRAQWLRHGEAFSIMFGLMGRFAPLTRRQEERAPPWLALYLRPIGIGLLDGGVVSVSIVVFVMAMLSAVTFDGFLETPLYQAMLTTIYSAPGLEEPLFRLSEASGLEEGALVSSALLVVSIILFAAALFLTSALMRQLVRGPVGHAAPAAAKIAGCFVLTLVPIAVAYHLAHYLSLLLTAGQFIIPLASDPFGLGWNLFGTAGYQTDLGIVGPRFFWYTSVTAILVGHMISVYLAHVIAIRVFGNRRRALISQIPMILLMVGYTMISLWILAQPVVS